MNWIYALVWSSWGGTEYKSETCLPSCTLLSAHSSYLQSEQNTNWSTNSIGLWFEETVKVEHIVWVYDFQALVVEIGSCLGLWLGLSVVGVFDGIVLTILHAKKMFDKNID